MGVREDLKAGSIRRHTVQRAAFKGGRGSNEGGVEEEPEHPPVDVMRLVD